MPSRLVKISIICDVQTASSRWEAPPRGAVLQPHGSLREHSMACGTSSKLPTFQQVSWLVKTIAWKTMGLPKMANSEDCFMGL